jgi:hypothetical protein
MGLQSCGSPNLGDFGTPGTKSPFGCRSHGQTQSILYGGRWWLPPSLGRGESCVSVLPVACPSTKSVPTMHLSPCVGFVKACVSE